MQPTSFWLVTIVLLFAIVTIMLFLIYGSYSRYERVVGYLVPDKGSIKVYAPFVGFVKQKYIVDNQQVNKGDVLLEVSTQRGLPDGLSVNKHLISQLQIRKELLEKRIDNELLVFTSESSHLKLSLGNINSEIKQLTQQLEIKQLQLDIAMEQWQKYKNFQQKNLIVESELVDKTNSYLSAKVALKSIKLQIISKRSIRYNTQKQIQQLPLRENNLMQELQNTLILLNQKLIEYEGNESYTITAPVGGRITSIQASIGQSVKSSVSLLIIIPNNTVLYVELFLPSRAIGFVEIGQKVLIKYDAFPYQQFGLYEGIVDQIAQAIIDPNEVNIPLPTNEPVYRVKVLLNSQHINAYGKQLKLQSGMLVTADIILEERSLGKWLFAPLYNLTRRL